MIIKTNLTVMGCRVLLDIPESIPHDIHRDHALASTAADILDAVVERGLEDAGISRYFRNTAS